MPRTMMAVVKTEPREGAEYTEIDRPVPGPGEVLLKVRATSICGTDVHIYKWDPWAASKLRAPLVFGHEFCGDVVEVGQGVTRANVGDFASVESHIPCGTCDLCRSNQMHICAKMKIFGIDRPGSFAQYVTVPEICLWIHRRPIRPEVASLMEPLGNGVFAASSADVAGKTCAVFGCGPAGIFTIMSAKALGAKRVFAVEIDPGRGELGREAGADQVIDGSARNIHEELVRANGGPLDVSFEMSGSPAALAGALKCLRNGGTCVAFGIPSGPVTVDLAADVILSGRRILGIVGRHMFETWKLMQELLDAGRLRPEIVITHRFRLSGFREAFETILSKKVRVGKIVMFPEGAEETG